MSLKVTISEELKNVFLSSRKNYNYSLNFLLSSIDLKTCPECMKLIKVFDLSGNRIEVEIDDNNIKTIKSFFGNTENALIEQLLWISILFPEI